MFERGAARGTAACKQWLADMLEDGIGGPADIPLALQVRAEAAEGGDCEGGAWSLSVCEEWCSEESSKMRELENREREKERNGRGGKKTTRKPTTQQGPCAQTLERDK